MTQVTTKPRGFTLGELLAVLLVLSVTAAILFPVVTDCGMSKERTQRNQCMSNLKLIGLAALTYAQDNDGTLPPVYAEAPASRLYYSGKWMLLWLGMNKIVNQNRTPEFSIDDSLLMAYLKERDYTTCPTPLTGGSSATYLTSDLCGGMKSNAFVAGEKTVMASDGDGIFPVVGHSIDLPQKRFQRWNQTTGEFFPGSATQNGIMRHSGGASYLLADGHVHWYKPEHVFFPLRESGSKTHRDSLTGKTIGPDPSGDMTYAGRKYAATFHVR